MPDRAQRFGVLTSMDVYFIPVGPGRYELYCEVEDDTDALVDDAPSTGRLAGLYQTFRVALARVEQERAAGERAAQDGPRSWTERAKDRALRWVAERIAEQRLLWRLRKEAALSLVHPDDMTGDEAVLLARAALQREADRHLKWTIVDGTLFAASGVVALVPGPNLLAYYFGFRLVGHYLSRRGARHGLTAVEWRANASPALTSLRHALALDGAERSARVLAVAAELRLPKLSKFFERTSSKPA